MKRKCLILLLAAAMTLSACGSSQLTMPESQTGSQEEIQSEEPTVSNESSEEVTSEPDSKLSESGLSDDTSISSVSVKEEETEAYAAYLKVLQDNKDAIDAYTWQDESYENDKLIYGTVYPVALADVYGDEIPELIFMRSDGTSHNGTYFIADIVVCTYENFGIKTLYDEAIDKQVAGGTNYCIFTGKDGSLYRYDGIGDEGWTYTYIRLTESEGALRETDKIWQDSYPDEARDNWIDKYYHFDSEISKEEYESIKKSYYDNLDRILLSGDNDDEVLIPYAESNGTEAMTYDEAVEKLTALSAANPNKDDSTADNKNTENAAATAAFTDVFRNMSERTMYFSSGAGGWSTDLEIGEDGTFTGQYHDSDMGDTGDGYPNGTCYICDFTGRFVITDQIDESIYRMKIEELASEKEILTEWIADGIRYVGAAPYGLSGGKEFLLYLPGLPMSKLTDDGLSWYRMPRGIGDSELPETLPCYGIYNTATGDAFYSG